MQSGGAKWNPVVLHWKEVAEQETLKPFKEEAANLMLGRDAPSWGRGRELGGCPRKTFRQKSPCLDISGEAMRPGRV